MVSLTIDGQTTQVPEGSTILDAIESVGISVPRLCYWKNINKIGACRMCVVEIEGKERLVASCDVQAEEGMVIHTDSPRVIEARKINLQLILSQHKTDCKTCVRSGSCALQDLLRQLKLKFNDQPYEQKFEKNVLDPDSPLIKEADKCVKCMRCIQVCEKHQTVNVWRVSGTGSRTTVCTVGNKPISQTNCTYCGQCVTHCPIGSLTARDDAVKVAEALADQDLTVVALLSPSSRVSSAEEFGIDSETPSTSRLISALYRTGFSFVFDLKIGADLMVLEEGRELLERLQKRDSYSQPLFSSNCLSWRRFVKSQFPEFTGCLSSIKTPEQILGSVVKQFFPQNSGIDPQKIRIVSIVPCMSKKRDVYLQTGTFNDVDYVLTTREFARLLKLRGWQRQNLTLESFDSPVKEVITGETLLDISGGTASAILKSTYRLATGKAPEPDALKRTSGVQLWDELEIDIPKLGSVKAAVASSHGKARELLNALKKNKVQYDYVEVMACPRGCIAGGGQLIHDATVYRNFIDRVKERLDVEQQAVSHGEDLRNWYTECLGDKSQQLFQVKRNV